MDQWVAQDSTLLKPTQSPPCLLASSDLRYLTLAIDVARCKPLKSKLALAGKNNATMRFYLQ